MLSEPLPVLSVTETTVLRHLKGEPGHRHPGMRVPRVAVSRGFTYLGPVFLGVEEMNEEHKGCRKELP